MTRRFAALALSTALLLTGLSPGPAAAASAPIPSTMAALGDSITRAASTGGSLGADAEWNSWSTGTTATVSSHFLRLRGELSPNLVAYNLAVSGAKVANCGSTHACFGDQVAPVLDLPTEPEYVTVLIGGNDLCTDTAGAMTSVEVFRTEFARAIKALMDGTSATHVYVVSIPDVYQLWSLFRSNWFARIVWSAGGICQSLLANPTSTQQADVQRRADVRARNQAFNAIIADVCEDYGRCHHDAGRVFAYQFARSDVSGDYFHPSASGQANLARETWIAGYSWISSPPPNQAPVAAFDVACDGLSCSFDASDSIDDAGIVGYAWEFGDGSTGGGVTVTHAYSATGAYGVTLMVTDAAGLTGTLTGTINVAEPPSTSISLSISASKVKGVKTASLTWSGATATSVDIMRDGALVTTTANDGTHTDSIGKGGGTHTYQVCESGTSTCSNVASASY